MINEVIVASSNNTLRANGEGLAFFGLVIGIPWTVFGRRKFKPITRGANYGRWRALHWMGIPILCLGVIGLIMIIAGQA